MRGKIVRDVAVGVAVLALACVPLGGAVASAGQSRADSRQCSIDQLPIPGRGESEEGQVFGGDPTGHYLYGEAYVNDRKWAHVLWVGGKPRVLRGLPRNPNGYVGDVNSAGVLVGAMQVNGWNFAWRYTDGKYTVLPAPFDAEQVVATGINAAGDIVGYYDGPSEGQDNHPLLWPADEPGTFHELPARTDASAHDIADNGVIFGYEEHEFYRTYIWKNPNSQPVRLQDPEGGPDTFTFELSANGKWLAGEHYANDGAAAVWNLEDGTIRSYPDQFEDAIGFHSVNDSGDATSDYNGADEDDFTSDLVLADGTVVDLGAMASVLPNRGSEITAAGFSVTLDGDEEKKTPVVSHC